MPLLVRLALPRFYVQGDQAVVSAIVQNYTGSARTVQVHIEAHGATLTGERRARSSLRRAGSSGWTGRRRWTLRQPPPRQGGGGGAVLA